MTVSKERRSSFRRVLLIFFVFFIGTGGWLLFRLYSSAERRQLRSFLSAWSDGDFHAMYLMFAPVDRAGPWDAGLPLLPEAELQRVLGDQSVRVPARIRPGGIWSLAISDTYGLAGFAVRLKELPETPSTEASRPFALVVSVDRETKRIRAFSTFYDLLNANYGRARAEAFSRTYKQAAMAGGWKPPQNPGATFVPPEETPVGSH